MTNEFEDRDKPRTEVSDSISDADSDTTAHQIVLLKRQLQHEISEHQNTRSLLLKFSLAIEHAGDAVMITNAAGDIEYINPAFSQITGYQTDEVIGKNPRILKSTAQDASVYADLWQTITSGHTWRGAMVERRKDGSFYPANVSIAPIRDDQGEITHFVAIQHDASERQELEERMRQTQKMESLGVLVGGIAHDFNNMLASILGNMFIARSKLEPDSPALQYINNTEKVSSTASEMIKQLLAFSRKDKVEILPFPFIPFIKEAVKLTRISVPEDIHFDFICCNDSLQLRGDTTQLQQILMNLINNARDALTEMADRDKTITLLVEKTEPDAAFRQRFPAMQADHYIHLAVSDNGCGIPREQLGKVTQPFFTTKGVGKGTGLGLSLVSDSVQAHGGVLDIHSEASKGSTFHIYLPVDPEAMPVQPVHIEESIHYGQGECILIVDDDPVVRMSGRNVLEHLGYSVLEASDGREAVHLFSEHHEKIAMVIIDLIMPRLGGIQAAALMREINPAVQIIYITSYEPGKFEKFSPQTDDITLRKPYSITQLSLTIRNQLAN